VTGSRNARSRTHPGADSEAITAFSSRFAGRRPRLTVAIPSLTASPLIKNQGPHKCCHHPYRPATRRMSLSVRSVSTVNRHQ
jgi:hypothetical protein